MAYSQCVYELNPICATQLIWSFFLFNASHILVMYYIVVVRKTAQQGQIENKTKLSKHAFENIHLTTYCTWTLFFENC